MKRKLSLIVLLIVMIMVPTVIVEASDGLDNLDIISIEINKKELVEGDTFNLQANISGDTSQVDELVFKYKLKNTNDTKELKLGYNNEKKLWELNLQINKDWKDGVWELYEVDYSLIQDTNYQTLECHECYADANFTVVRSTDSSIDIEKKQAEKDQVEKSQVEKSQNVELTASTINGSYVEKVDWTVDKKSPQDLGSSIKITANAEGGKDVVYLFQIKKDGVWKTLRSYSEDNTYTWTPDEPGEYLFSVIARDKHTWEKSAFMNKRYTINGNYVKEVDWTADKQSPQDLGSSIKITANSKGSDNAVYLFQIKKDGVWKTLRGYSEDNTYIWTPDEPGEYLFSVIARDKYTWDEFVFMNKRYTINTINTIGGKNSYYITYYDKSFEEALKIQMSRNPQTDLYGGGWKTAKQEDVAYYLNPKNFLQFTPVEGTSQNDIVKVTASTLNVRSQPTVNSNILTQVFNGSTYKVLGESNGWYKIEANNKIGWISGQYVIATSDIQYLNTIQVTATVLNVREKPTTNSSIVSQVKAGSAYIVLDKSNGWYKINANGKIGWVYGEYVNSVNDFPREMYQFLVLSGTSGISINDLNNALRGKGILEGKGQAFIEAGKQHNVNELYLLSHAFLETGNGTSKLATGILVDKVDGKAVTPRVVYNMFGIGAADKDPLRLGAEYAYKEGWFTPEAAIIGGAKFISKSYINNPNYQQDTLYKMRWNPISPGSHQYATDIGWALKQTRNIDIMMEICAQSSSVTLRFDIPKYR